MATQNTTLFILVSECFNAAATFAERVEALRAKCKKDKVSFETKAIKAYLAPATAAHYGVQLVAKERGEGETWDKDTKSQTAKKQNDRLAAAVIGERKDDKEPKPEVEVPAELVEAARKLAKLAAKYEGARALASKAVAIAFTE